MGLGLLVLVGGCGAVAVGLSVVADDVIADLEARFEEIQGDVTGCEVLGAAEDDPTVLEVRCEVTNNSSKRSTYSWTVEASVDDQRYGTATFSVDEVRPGETANPVVELRPDDPQEPPDPAAVELDVFGVIRFSAEG